MHIEVIKTLKRIAENEGDSGILKRLFEISDILKQINSSLRIAYKEGLKGKEWKAYQTLVDVKTDYLNELKEIEEKAKKEWAYANQE